jgi:hypothetical protein
VRAVEKTGRASNAASYAGVIDRMAPTVSSMSDMSATDPVQIPAGASVTLPTHSVAAPKIAMLNLTTNQNVCKNATFSLSYRGSAHS